MARAPAGEPGAGGPGRRHRRAPDAGPLSLLRPGLAAFRKTYGFVAATPLGEARRMSQELRDELRVARGLIVLAGSKLDLETAPAGFMSDSSARGYALHGAPLMSAKAHDIAAFAERSRFVERKTLARVDEERFLGSLASFDADESARPREVVEVGPSPPPLPDLVVSADRWTRLLYGAWRERGKIHALEQRTEVMVLRMACEDLSRHGCLVVSIGDDLSAILAFEKGRGRCADLLAQCRRAAALTLASGTRWRQRHVESARNVTDGDSRAADRGELRGGEARRASVAAQRRAGPHGPRRPGRAEGGATAMAAQERGSRERGAERPAIAGGERAADGQKGVRAAPTQTPARSAARGRLAATSASTEPADPPLRPSCRSEGAELSWRTRRQRSGCEPRMSPPSNKHSSCGSFGCLGRAARRAPGSP